MPFLDPPFQHDVFVSYAHGEGGKLLQWFHRLVDELKDEIVSLVSALKKIDIFIDPKPDPIKPLTEQLRDKVRSSGLLLVVMSEHYLESVWCQKEPGWFEGELRAYQAGGGLVMVVRVQRTKHDDWPECLKDKDGHTLIGFTFHPKGGNGETVIRPHGRPLPNPGNTKHDRYYEELCKLTTIITKRLQEINDKTALRAHADTSRLRNPIGDRVGIYLQTSASEAEVWWLAKQRLKDAGYDVFPEALPDIDGDFKSIQKTRRDRLETMRENANAICLLGSRDAESLGKEIEAITQDHTALKAFGYEMPCLLLNRAEEKPTLARELGIEIVDHNADDWLDRLQAPLARMLSAEMTS